MRVFSLPVLPLPFLLCFLLLFAPGSAVAEDEPARGNLPPAVEQALSSLLDATPAGQPLPLIATDTLLRFVLDNSATPAKKIIPQNRPHGTSAFGRYTLAVPLRDVLSYTLNPHIPASALYPTSIRRNAWLADSPLLRDYTTLLDAPLPPQKPLFTRGTEEEETTPDTSSGCTYVYLLQRLFILTGLDGRAALLSVSVMPKESTLGNKGVLVSDQDWLYMYTGEVGTNLPLLGWAKTAIYGSAAVAVYMESAPKAAATTVSLFKWTKAGWSGMNAVKPHHIEEGITRFIDGMRQVLEAPRRPSPAALTAETARLRALDDQALRAAAGMDAALSASNNKTLTKKPYRDILKNGYSASLSREDLLAEAVRAYLRKALLPDSAGNPS